MMIKKKQKKNKTYSFEIKLTHLTQDKMDTTTFSNAFLWMESLYFDLLDFTEVYFQDSNW